MEVLWGVGGEGMMIEWMGDERGGRGRECVRWEEWMNEWEEWKMRKREGEKEGKRERGGRDCV